MKSLENDQFELYNGHIQIIRQLTQTIRKYDTVIQLLRETDEKNNTSINNTEIDFFKDIRDSLNKQLGEHEGLCFVISKLVTIK
jgi:hypothetical protein